MNACDVHAIEELLSCFHIPVLDLSESRGETEVVLAKHICVRSFDLKHSRYRVSRFRR